MAHFNFVISQNAKWGHAGFYIDCHRMTVPENIFLQKSTAQYHHFISTEHLEPVQTCQQQHSMTAVHSSSMRV